VAYSGAEVLLAEVGEAGRVQPGGEQGERAVGDGGQPVQPEQPPGFAVERVPDLRWRGHDRRAGHRERGFQALAAQRIGEAAEQADLLDDLVVADEGALAPDPDQVSQAHQVEQGLADRGEADAEVLGVLPFVRELLPRPQAAAVDLVLQQLTELVVQRNR
jgi:hypothetical protein